MLGYWFLQPYAGKNKLKSPKDLLTFDFDEQPKPKELSEEEKAARAEKFARWDAEMRQKYGAK